MAVVLLFDGIRIVVTLLLPWFILTPPHSFHRLHSFSLLSLFLFFLTVTSYGIPPTSSISLPSFIRPSLPLSLPPSLTDSRAILLLHLFTTLLPFSPFSFLPFFPSPRLSVQEYDTDITVTAPLPMIIDLHGYTMPIARAAVRSALYMLRDEAGIDFELQELRG